MSIDQNSILCSHHRGFKCRICYICGDTPPPARQSAQAAQYNWVAGLPQTESMRPPYHHPFLIPVSEE